MASAKQLPEEQMQLLHQLFSVLDGDHNGSINWSEFVLFQSKSRLLLGDQNDWDINDINSLREEFSELDVNGDGKISRSEFVTVMGKCLMTGSESGRAIVSAMIRKVLKVEEEPPSADPKTQFVEGMMRDFDAADLDGDGNIDFGEFIRSKMTQEDTDRNFDLKKLRREFRRNDTDRDGMISRHELRHY